MVQGLILIASRAFEWRMAFAITDGLLALAVIAPIVTLASHVVWFNGKVRDRGNAIVV
jgi:hypothetical protein